MPPPRVPTNFSHSAADGSRDANAHSHARVHTHTRRDRVRNWVGERPIPSGEAGKEQNGKEKARPREVETRRRGWKERIYIYMQGTKGTYSSSKEPEGMGERGREGKRERARRARNKARGRERGREQESARAQTRRRE